MGEVAEMMMEGILCEQCGVYIDSEGSAYAGHPRTCSSCKREAGITRAKVKCPVCGKQCNGTLGLKQHTEAKHGEQKPAEAATDSTPAQ